MKPNYHFALNERLGIELPYLHTDWEELSHEERHDMILRWEKIKAHIPDRIMEVEKQIEQRQLQVAQEEDWDTVCRLYEEIYTFASIINDLHIWARVNQDFEETPDLAEEHQNREK
ncbi:hypothetical protein [Effusibacillus dendaii]|uniref:Uncharacterized protein n=1 Tax=Effusibacillus dendaii TaxID=2743772 RepID=A0A7I8DE61_9BACL|nr:hypothetical protein [Effusibacillus dendaii]BCJ86800.1 hypothetical protein skT53_17850 [Effusibacillus dendaii]